jgi:D-amino-acid dehydrogenase
MKVVVLGSGVIGVTSAWYLAQAGHEVVVIDRQSGPALETSFANAGEVSPGYASPWAAPGIPAQALKWLFMRHAPLIIRPRPSLAMASWMAAMLRECSADRYVVNKSRMIRLAQYSLEKLKDLRAETGIEYDQRSRGTLQLFRSAEQVEKVAKDIKVLKADGVPFEVLDRAGCIAAEPGLANSQVDIAGGLRLPLDETGDCFQFTTALTQLAKQRGVHFLFGRIIHRLETANDRMSAVITDLGRVEADQVLVALGSFTPAMVRSLGLKVPVYPIKGYSMTLPIMAHRNAPVSTLLDESFKVAITRLGDRIRVGGMAEISGFTKDLPPARRATLEHSLTSLFPSAGRVSEATFWSGLRPMTPDGTPIVGPTNVPNLFLNTGHGTLGWTMACGSGQLISDLMSGETPAIRADDLALSRY